MNVPIHCYVDNNSLIENVHSSTNVKEDQRLILDMCALKEMKERGEIETINWVSKDKQLADPMTKAGASPSGLQRTLCTGILKSMSSV